MQQAKFVILVVVLLNIVVVGAMLLSGKRSCSDALQSETHDKARIEIAQPERVNVIFISMDAMRWDRTGISGNGDGLTPNLDRFAESAVVFHNATSAAPWTLPSHMAVWDGAVYSAC